MELKIKKLYLAFSVERLAYRKKILSAIRYPLSALLIFTFCILHFKFCYAMDSKGAVKEAVVESSEQDDPYFWDFGKADKNAVLTHEFVFKNESKAVLNIDSVTTSCGCTVSEV